MPADPSRLRLGHSCALAWRSISTAHSLVATAAMRAQLEPECHARGSRHVSNAARWVEALRQGAMRCALLWRAYASRRARTLACAAQLCYSGCTMHPRRSALPRATPAYLPAAQPHATRSAAAAHWRALLERAGYARSQTSAKRRFRLSTSAADGASRQAPARAGRCCLCSCTRAHAFWLLRTPA